MQFGTAGLGLPGLALPWTERRLKASELTVRLEPPRPAPPASPPEPLRLTMSQELSLEKAARPRAAPVARADKPFEVRLQNSVAEAPPPVAASVTPLAGSAPAPAPRLQARERKARTKARPPILVQRNPQQETFKVPRQKRADPEQQQVVVSAAKKEIEAPAVPPPTEPVARAQPDEAGRLEAQEAERRRAEEDAARRTVAEQKEAEARKQEEAQRLALQDEARSLAEAAARQAAEEMARQRALALQTEQKAREVEEARKEEQARIQQEQKKQAELRRLAVEAEALKRVEDAAREQAAARQKELQARRQAEEAAARAQELAERQRMEGEAAAQRERDRLAVQKAPGIAPGSLSGGELAAKALEELRAARTDPLRKPSPPPSAENPRRRSLFGVERDVSLRMYVDSWRWKIERNGTLNYRHAATWRVHENPVVTVSIRSDGSLEDVFIHKSSGVRELDDAVRRIARLHSPYSAFPPDLARQYDVIEIRRVWFFDKTLRILDEM